MKVLFIYPNLGGPIGFNIGISILSSLLKNDAHKVKLVHLNESLGFPLDLERIKKTILDYEPDLIGISVNTNQFLIGIKIAKFIKDKVNNSIPILFGGVHPTLSPEQTLGYDCVDMVIVGEGEEAILELVRKLEKKEDISQIKNLWLKKGSNIIKNRLRSFISLDKVPFMDVSIYNYQEVIDARNGWIDVILGRGCPSNCTYCFNKPYKELYAKYCDSGEIKRYVRKGDYIKTIKGIKKILEDYGGVKCVSFVDDDFLVDLNITKFIRLFKEEINLPFVVNANINSINEEKLKELKEAGCDLIRAGIECGNEKIRKRILNRHFEDDTIINKIGLVKKYGIRIFTYNMIGLPTEKHEDIIKTLKLNVQCAPDIVKISTFYPYEGTEIYSLCKNLGLISEDMHNHTLTYYDKTILNFNDDFVLFIEKVQKYFDCYLNYYTDQVSNMYKSLIETINSLSRKEWENKEVQKSIQEERDLISKQLSSKKLPHYVMKFTSYFAVITD